MSEGLEQAGRAGGAHGGEAAIVAAWLDPRPEVRDNAIALAARHLPPETLGRYVGDDDNATLRNAALVALERQGPYAVPHLMSLARGDNPEVAMFAVQILSRIRDPATVQALLPLISHQNSNIAQAAVEALGALRATQAVPALLRLLQGEPWLQFAAVAALGEIGDARAVQPLLDSTSNEMLAEPAVEALGKIGSPEALPHLLSLLADLDRLPVRDQVLRAAAAMLDPVAPSVFTRFRRKLDEGQQEASLFEYLEALLTSNEQQLARAAASLVLAAQLDRLYPALVLRALSPDLEEARWTAARCQHHARSLRLALAELLRHPDARVRRGALLCAPADSNAAALLADPDPGVRAAACQSLGRCRDVAAIPALVERFGRGTPPESLAAAEALGRMPGQSLLPLAPLLEREDTVLSTLEVLEAAKSPLFPDRIVELLQAPSASVRRAALRVLVYHDLDYEGLLVRSMQDEDESVRIEAVELIVRNGSTRAMPAMIALLPVSNDLRYHLIRALGRLRAMAAAPDLERLFPAAKGHERLEIVLALIRIGAPGLLRFLEERLAEGNPEVRRVAADGVARIARAAELTLLIQLARDPDWNVRNHAGWGLGRLGLRQGREALLDLVRDTEPIVARTARAALAKLPANP